MTTELLSIEAAGRALGVSRATVWRMIKGGALPTVKQGGRRLVRASALSKQSRARRIGRIPAFTPDHPIFRLVGAGRGGGQAPGARDKHAILDE